MSRVRILPGPPVDVRPRSYAPPVRRERFGNWTLLMPETRRERATGLLGRRDLDPWTALVLRRCRSVHSVGMRFPIDVVVIDRRGRVVRIVPLRPGRFMPPSLRGTHIIEVAAGRGEAFVRSRARLFA